MTITRHVDIFDLDLISHNLFFEDFDITFLFDLFICNDSITILNDVLDFALTTSALYKRLPKSDSSPATKIPSIHDKTSKETLKLTLDTPSGEPSTSECLCLDYRPDWEWPLRRLNRPFFTFAGVNLFGRWLNVEQLGKGNVLDTLTILIKINS